MEIWDAYFKDGSLANVDLIRGEPIPEGLHHLVCEILVRHTDGDYLVMQRDFTKPNFGGYFEATAGGSALKGEDKITCAKRELLEETGITADFLEEIGTFRSHNTIYVQFLCVTDYDKASVSLQEGETVSYRWLTEKEFIAFVNSDELIPVHKVRYADYFQKLGYVQNRHVLSKTQYLANPCRAASIPYWKMARLQLPADMRIVHEDEFDPGFLEQYTDETYFRLKHDLQDLATPQLPDGFAVCAASIREYAQHINGCYAAIGISESELQGYTQRQVYCPDLWLAVRDTATGEIAATGIAELDREIHEGVLEWIQVSPQYRGRGLGKFLVLELLRRMKPTADSATVSGQCSNPTSPEQLYRKCGFTGHDVWHILRRKAHDRHS